MMKAKRIFFLFLSFFFLQSWAVPVSPSAAQKKACAWLSKVSGRQVLCEQQPIETATDSKGVPLYHVFNTAHGEGFVIVAADEGGDILGYSTTGSFNKQCIPSNMDAVLRHYTPRRSINGFRRLPNKAPAREAISPLLSTQWDQGESTPQGDVYNQLCPTIDGDHCLTGCVATAMAQIMYYHQWPIEVSCDIPGYETNKVGILDPLPAISFDWDIIPANPIGEQSPEACATLAQLMYYCGNSVKTNYGLKRSEAYGSDAASALTTYFGYAPTRYLKCDDYAPEVWDEMIYKELSCSRPVIYFGFSGKGGHAFICDGCDGEGFYHINWGWGGQSDGFFKLSELTPDHDDAEGLVAGNYTLNQHAILGIAPHDESSGHIEFADSAVKDICISHWDADNDGELSYAEAKAVLTLNGAFSGDSTLTQFDELQYFTHLQRLGKATFRGCSHLQSITLPESLESIGDEAFKGCAALQSVTIPANVSSIGESVFVGCRSLTHLSVAPANTSYDSRNGCGAIIHTESNTLVAGCMNSQIPNDVEEIGASAFEGCDRIETITLPARLRVIGDRAFAGCISLATIHAERQQPPQCGEDAFLQCHTLVYVPKGMKMRYKTAPGWRNLVIVEEETDDFIHCEPFAFTKSVGGLLRLNLRNSDDVVGVQFCLTLPDGFSIRKAGGQYDIHGTERLSKHFVFCNKKDENSYQILAMSMDLDQIEGHEGAMMEIGIEAADSLEAGIYEMRFSDITISIIEDEDISGVRPPDFTEPIKIREFDLGDVNCDHHVNIADVMMIVNHILLYPIENFNEENADVNEDRRIDVVDVTKVVQFILKQPKVNAEDDAEPGPDEPELFANTSDIYTLYLNQASHFTAMQMRIDLPEGGDISGIRMRGHNGHQVVASPLGGNSYRVVVYSPDGRPFDSTAELLDIDTNGLADGITINDMVLTNQQFETIGVGRVTGIRHPRVSENEEVQDDCYNLSGQRISKGYKGIVIRNGRKMVRR
ncbi:MAG: C10 family peptidase [Prevotella sp.]|nr:C10 family peptidase [Prevotella sp.]